jgi:hypothetical protein
VSSLIHTRVRLHQYRLKTQSPKLNGKKSQDISGAYNTPNPNSLRYNVGTGYQWSMISRKLIANIGFGIGGYSDSDGTKLHLMFTPSVGYIF